MKYVNLIQGCSNIAGFVVHFYGWLHSVLFVAYVVVDFKF